MAAKVTVTLAKVSNSSGAGYTGDTMPVLDDAVSSTDQMADVSPGDVVQFHHNVDLRAKVNVSETNLPKMVNNPAFAGIDIYDPADSQADVFFIQVQEGDLVRSFTGYTAGDLADTLAKYGLD